MIYIHQALSVGCKQHLALSSIGAIQLRTEYEATASMSGNSGEREPASIDWTRVPAATLVLAQWLDAVDERYWKQMLGRRPAEIFALDDAQVGASQGQLRALSLLRALGVTTFTLARGWQDLALARSPWQRMVADTLPAALIIAFPLCHTLSQENEHLAEGDVVGTILQAHELAVPEALLIFVFDTPRFAPKRDVHVRSSSGEDPCIQVLSWAELPFSQAIYSLDTGPRSGIKERMTIRLQLREVTPLRCVRAVPREGAFG